jgi:hypothetical protein
LFLFLFFFFFFFFSFFASTCSRPSALAHPRLLRLYFRLQPPHTRLTRERMGNSVRL